MSKKSWRNSVRSHSLQTHREFYSDERDLREDRNEELNKLFLVKIQLREKIFWLSTAWRFRTWSEEIQHVRWLSRDERWTLEDDICWKPINGQIKLSVREYTCVVNWRRRAVFTRNAAQEVAKKLKKWENAAVKKKMELLDKSWMNISCSMIRNLEQRVYHGIKFENCKNDWNLLKIRKSTKILTHRAVRVGSAHASH